ncbi:IS200/IS605 family element transposase accessory protein TnpB [Thiothrix subterranea]|uniref:RNA-guided endonuclease InsQ/TnpB family protein n=1 Tax=Thiothrix subterranea TaxID=2735563 RepID=UPI00192AE3FA|nr:RNA-guided endonuclease TnpB family protein [Thiothrix subterranea]QQZ28372.1 IS200/IS605 family element transposase accessory protein TnpB [Thiothrix subterranea]
MIISHKIRLDPNNKQATYLAKAAGTARFAYNWALAEWQTQYAAWKNDNSQPKPNQMGLRRQLNAIKREQFPWMLEVTKNAPQMAIIQLGAAFKNFFAGRAQYPQFKKKGKSRDSFTLTNDQFAIDASRIRIPNLGLVRMRETLRFSGKILSATISRTADQWFVSYTVDTQDHNHLPPAENQGDTLSLSKGTVGVDLGVSALATLSTGEKVVGAKPHKALLSRLKRLSRSLSRKVKGSANRHKAKQKLAKLHARIANIRQDSLHQLTTDLTRRFHTIGIEDLNVSGMVKNRHLSRAISDMGFFEFRRQLEYKAEMRGAVVVVADRFFASSKTCSALGCGHKVDKMPLSVREWTCPDCGAVHDRDVNAANNLQEYASATLSNHAVSSTVSACGGEGSGFRCKPKVKPAPVKQEFNRKLDLG